MNERGLFGRRIAMQGEVDAVRIPEDHRRVRVAASTVRIETEPGRGEAHRALVIPDG